MLKIAAISVALTLSPAMADAKPKVPCSEHTAFTKVTKKKCVAMYKQTVRNRLRARNLQIRRDRARWPAKPVTVRDLRVRGVNIRRFARLGKCEAGPGEGRFGVRWSTPAGYTYQGGLGIFRRTHQSVGHPYNRNLGSESWRVQMLVGKRVKQKYGISAWGAYRKQPNACWFG